MACTDNTKRGEPKMSANGEGGETEIVYVPDRVPDPVVPETSILKQVLRSGHTLLLFLLPLAENLGNTVACAGLTASSEH